MFYDTKVFSARKESEITTPAILATTFCYRHIEMLTKTKNRTCDLTFPKKKPQIIYIYIYIFL